MPEYRHGRPCDEHDRGESRVGTRPETGVRGVDSGGRQTGNHPRSSLRLTAN